MITTDTLWRQLHDSLRDQISSGTLKPGDRLPAEPELMAAHHIKSRATVATAIRALAAEGLIDGRRRVAERRPITLRMSDEESITFIEDMARSGHVVEPPEIEVGIEDGELVRYVLRVVDGEPHNWARWAFPLKHARNTRLEDRADIVKGSIRLLKEDLGWTGLVQEKPWIEVRPPTSEETAMLRAPAGWNVILEHRTGTQDGVRVFASTRILRADRTRLIP